MKRFAIVSLIATVAAIDVSSVSQVAAGDFWGSGGVIRGSVGDFVDKQLSPPAQKFIEVEAAKGGAGLGGYVGGPAGAVIGAVGGREVGRRFNECVAGKCPMGHAAGTDAYSKETTPKSDEMSNRVVAAQRGTGKKLTCAEVDEWIRKLPPGSARPTMYCDH